MVESDTSLLRRRLRRDGPKRQVQALRMCQLLPQVRRGGHGTASGLPKRMLDLLEDVQIRTLDTGTRFSEVVDVIYSRCWAAVTDGPSRPEDCNSVPQM